MPEIAADGATRGPVLHPYDPLVASQPVARVPLEVDRSRLQEFRELTGVVEGFGVPPGYALPLVLPALTALLSNHAPELQNQPILHAEQVFNFTHTLDPRRDYVVVARLTDIVAYGWGTGLVVSTQIETADLSPPGVAINGTSIFVVRTLRPVGLARFSPSRTFPSKTFQLSRIQRSVDLEVSERYARVSGDYQRIHVEDNAARVAGFGQAIVHGSLVLALILRDVVEFACDGDQRLVRRASVAFGAAAPLGSTLTFSVFRSEDPAVVILEVDASGAPVIKRGSVVVAHRVANRRASVAP